jgi:hypothetical protein
MLFLMLKIMAIAATLNESHTIGQHGSATVRDTENADRAERPEQVEWGI